METQALDSTHTRPASPHAHPDNGQNTRHDWSQEEWVAVWQPWPPEPLRVFGGR